VTPSTPNQMILAISDKPEDGLAPSRVLNSKMRNYLTKFFGYAFEDVAEAVNIMPYWSVEKLLGAPRDSWLRWAGRDLIQDYVSEIIHDYTRVVFLGKRVSKALGFPELDYLEESTLPIYAKRTARWVHMPVHLFPHPQREWAWWSDPKNRIATQRAGRKLVA